MTQVMGTNFIIIKIDEVYIIHIDKIIFENKIKKIKSY